METWFSVTDVRFGTIIYVVLDFLLFLKIPNFGTAVLVLYINTSTIAIIEN